MLENRREKFLNETTTLDKDFRHEEFKRDVKVSCAHQNIVNKLNLCLVSQPICIVGFGFPTMGSSYYERPKCTL